MNKTHKPNCNMKVPEKSIENVEKFKHLGTNVTN